MRIKKREVIIASVAALVAAIAVGLAFTYFSGVVTLPTTQSTHAQSAASCQTNYDGVVGVVHVTMATCTFPNGRIAYCVISTSEYCST
jgi:hypothetical protein